MISLGIEQNQAIKSIPEEATILENYAVVFMQKLSKLINL